MPNSTTVMQADPMSTEETEPVPEPRVYLVEDEPTVSDSIEFLVNSAGYVVEPYDSVEAFRAGFDPDMPGCAILDLHLPDGTGFDVLELIRGQQSGIPVIFVTGRSSVPKAVDAIKMGAVDFLEKPVDHSQLLQKTEDAIRNDLAAWRERQCVAGIRRRLDLLSDREREVLELVVVGGRTREVAANLGITVKTVERHRGSIMDKMDVPNVSTLVHDYMLAKFGGNGQPADAEVAG